ncbi:MAG: cytochrome c [Myxococcota bacterium]
MLVRLFAALGALAAVVVVVAGVAVWNITRRGVSTREAPGKLETVVARALRKAAIPAASRQQKNPIVMDDAKRAHARAHWADHCAVCHAADGSGTGVSGERMYPPAPDMRTAITQDLTDGEIYWIIQNGIRLSGMPAWGEAHADDPETWELVAFVRSLPGLTKDEVEAIESAMPVSAHERAEREAEDVFLRGD